MRSWVAFLAAVVLLLAGCAQPASPSDSTASDESPDAVLNTGVLRGLVVDPTIRPVTNAAVQIKQNATPVIEITTDGNGEFGIQDLAAGNYSVNVSKPGFIATEVPAQVIGGDNRPAPLEIVLVPAPADAAFVWPIVWDGLVACGATPQNWCAGINLVTGITVFSDESFKFLFDEFMEQQRTPDFLQVEFVWEPNAEVSNYAFAALWASTWEEWDTCLCTPNLFATEGGSTHILIQADKTVFEELDVGFSRGIGVGFSVGTGEDENLQDPSTYSVMVNQPFEGFFHVFYGCLPPDGWLFTVDGDPECDPKTLGAT